jgi:hypothetical protein
LQVPGKRRTCDGSQGAPRQDRIVAGAFVGFLSLSMQVGQRRPADIRALARDCSQHAWPYFEAICLRDTRNPFGQAREARLVAPAR